MKLKYKQPIHLFLIFEKINIFLWYSKKLNINHNIILLPNSWNYTLNLFIRNDLFLSNNSLIEASAIDLSNIKNNTESNLNIFNRNVNTILFFHYYNYFFKNKMTFMYILNSKKYKINSIDRLFENAGWLERELSEMYGINFLWKRDTRKLLLDYVKLEHPMLKNYQLEGSQDIFYNLLDNQVVALKNNVVEL